ncbi:unannotated protein [freshwater metagenome]|uniref:DNA-directed DNA polymerase n=1 Tax=freshwater metagenome TaxID=449393 RepID=A0A6J6BTS4_9ZZZZ|nr:DNA polymerase III subunit gamma/tau [Actinomycetota bacterium]
MAYQSLYRRYRPRRFSEVRGQEHVVGALRNAVHTHTEGHAYLFSGPRGTGKTSTARILAKALNCDNLQQGEPCCECTPCQDMEAGRSFDLFELDAASNNGVDAIRDLIERTAVGSPGRTKVYILDEVHMLSPGASNALLKTLEEPPDHVRFVLATTDPQKVLPTIKSRTQHFEFQLLSAQELETYVRWINADADLDVDEESIAWVVRQGRGSARDTLSALDQVVAAGGVVTRAEPVEQLFRALAAKDSGQAIGAVSDALAQGHDPRVLGKAFLDSLRDTFLLSLGVEVPHLMAEDAEQFGAWASKLGTPFLTRAMEAVGAALVDMRHAADPRVPLEVALVRLTSTADVSLAALLERVERLEQGAPVQPAQPARPSQPSQPASQSATPATATQPAASSSAGPGSGSGVADARAALAKAQSQPAPHAAAPPNPTRQSATAPPTPPPTPPPQPTAAPAQPAAPTPPAAAPAQPSTPTPPAAAPAQPAAPTPPAAAPAQPAAPTPHAAAPAQPSTPPASGQLPSIEELRAGFAEAVLPQLRGVSKAIFSTGDFVAVTADGAVFALENSPTRDRAERSRADVEAALAGHFGSPVALILIDKADSTKYGGSAPPTLATGSDRGPRTVRRPGSPELTADEHDEAELEDPRAINISELDNADDVAETGIDRLTRAFPGAKLIEVSEEKT